MRISVIKYTKKLLILIFFAAYEFSNAQGGGPPMITDDPGTPPKGHFELNVTANTNISETEKEYDIPLLDLNYGLNKHSELTFEIPYINYSSAKEKYNSFGNSILSIKYRFLDEETSKIAVSAYPQITFPANSKDSLEYLIPFEFAKTIDSLQVIGCEIGYGWAAKGYKYIKSGLLVSKEFSNKFEAILEFDAFYNIFSVKWNEIIVNAGARYTVNENIIILMAAGYNLNESKNIQTVLGVQFVF